MESNSYPMLSREQLLGFSKHTIVHTLILIPQWNCLSLISHTPLLGKTCVCFCVKKYNVTHVFTQSKYKVSLKNTF